MPKLAANNNGATSRTCPNLTIETNLPSSSITSLPIPPPVAVAYGLVPAAHRPWSIVYRPSSVVHRPAPTNPHSWG